MQQSQLSQQPTFELDSLQSGLAGLKYLSIYPFPACLIASFLVALVVLSHSATRPCHPSIVFISLHFFRASRPASHS